MPYPKWFSRKNFNVRHTRPTEKQVRQSVLLDPMFRWGLCDIGEPMFSRYYDDGLVVDYKFPDILTKPRYSRDIIIGPHGYIMTTPEYSDD